MLPDLIPAYYVLIAPCLTVAFDEVLSVYNRECVCEPTDDIQEAG